MRASPSRRAAAVVQTLAVAVAVSAAVAGASWAAQRAILRSPTDAELVAARIEGALLRYRYVRSEIHVDGEPVRRAECLEGWERRTPHRPAGRGARVAFADGERLIMGDRRIIRIARAAHPTGLPPVAEVQLAGCARALTNHIYSHLVSTRRIHARVARFRGRAALSLRVRTPRTRFTLYVDRVTLEPVGLKVRSRGIEAWSAVQPVKLTPQRKRAFLARFDG
jgi:hypothetical protein